MSLIVTSSAYALDLGIAPLRLGLDATQMADSVTVTNNGQHKVAMQAEALAWSQDGRGQTQLSATDVVLAVPPIFELEAGESQLIRVGLLQANQSIAELPFRLLLTELASPLSGQGPIGLKMRTRVSLPMFVKPLGFVSADLVLEAFMLTDGEARLRLLNSGQAHARLERLELLDLGPMDAVITKDLAAYILPGTSREFRIRVPEQQSIGYVRIHTSQSEPVELSVLINQIAEEAPEHAPDPTADINASG